HLLNCSNCDTGEIRPAARGQTKKGLRNLAWAFRMTVLAESLIPARDADNDRFDRRFAMTSPALVNICIILGMALQPVRAPAPRPALPPAALAKARLKAAQAAFKETRALYLEGRSRDIDRIYLWSLRWVEADQALSAPKTDPLAAHE